MAENDVLNNENNSTNSWNGITINVQGGGSASEEFLRWITSSGGTGIALLNAIMQNSSNINTTVGFADQSDSVVSKVRTSIYNAKKDILEAIKNTGYDENKTKQLEDILVVLELFATPLGKGPDSIIGHLDDNQRKIMEKVDQKSKSLLESVNGNHAAAIAKMGSIASDVSAILRNQQTILGNQEEILRLLRSGANPNPQPTPTPQLDPIPIPEPDPTPDPDPKPQPGPTPKPNPDPLPDPLPDPEPKPGPTPNPDPDPTPEPGPDDEDTSENEDNPNSPRYRRAKFLTEAMQQTAILAEPRRPWYKKLAKFAINHPVLTILAGAGIGLGLAGAACGVTAAAGFGAMLSTMNFFLPTLVISSGIGAVAGGATSLVSRLMPGSRREKLYTKFRK